MVTCGECKVIYAKNYSESRASAKTLTAMSYVIGSSTLFLVLSISTCPHYQIDLLVLSSLVNKDRTAVQSCFWRQSNCTSSRPQQSNESFHIFYCFCFVVGIRKDAGEEFLLWK
jgi:hypothetical protein